MIIKSKILLLAAYTFLSVSLSEGKVKVHLYWYKHPDDSRIEEGIRITSPTRTIMDLYCNNMAYLAERLIARRWHQ